jgi:hypothetical protein
MEEKHRAIDFLREREGEKYGILGKGVRTQDLYHLWFSLSLQGTNFFFVLNFLCGEGGFLWFCSGTWSIGIFSR